MNMNTRLGTAAERGLILVILGSSAVITFAITGWLYGVETACGGSAPFCKFLTGTWEIWAVAAPFTVFAVWFVNKLGEYEYERWMHGRTVSRRSYEEDPGFRLMACLFGHGRS